MALPRKWATVTNFTTGPDVGTPTRVDPGDALADEGFEPHGPCAAQYLNYLFGTINDSLHEPIESPELYATIHEDWMGVVLDSGVLYGSFPWLPGGDTGVVAVSNYGGDRSNPGVLNVQIPGDGATNVEFFWTVGDPTEEMTSFVRMREMTIVARIENHVDNLDVFYRCGLAQAGNTANGGTDSLGLVYQQGVDDANWKVRVLKASVATTTTLAPFVDGEFIVAKFRRNDATNNIDVYVNDETTPAVTILNADFPEDGCTFGGFCRTAASDTETCSFQTDLQVLRSSAFGRAPL